MLTKPYSRIQQHVLVAIQDVAIVERHHHKQTSATLEQIISRVAAPDQRSGPTLTSLQNMSSASTGTATESPTMPHMQQDPFPLSATQLLIKTTSASQVCDAFCNCQCHIRVQYRTPRWLAVVVGTLFYYSSVRPTFGVRSCNSTICRTGKPSSFSHFTYYFPAWIIRKAFACSIWKDLNGKNSSWAMTMPREIPNNNKCWHLIVNGDVRGIQDLLARREMSPYDVKPNGSSVLCVSQSDV
jgi:hypothetical protein